MQIVIQDKGATIKISFDGKPEHIVKGQIRTIKLIKPNIVELNLGLGRLDNVYIPFRAVTVPAVRDSEELLDSIAGMLTTAVVLGGGGGPPVGI